MQEVIHTRQSRKVEGKWQEICGKAKEREKNKKKMHYIFLFLPIRKCVVLFYVLSKCTITICNRKDEFILIWISRILSKNETKEKVKEINDSFPVCEKYSICCLMYNNNASQWSRM